MMLFLPLGVDNTELERLPRVSITIAAICIVAFFISWVIPSNPLGVGENELRSLLAPGPGVPSRVRGAVAVRFGPEAGAQHAPTRRGIRRSGERDEPAAGTE